MKTIQNKWVIKEKKIEKNKTESKVKTQFNVIRNNMHKTLRGIRK